MKTFGVVLILLLPMVHIYAEPDFYLSPGISIAWGKKTVVYGWKVSIGNTYDCSNKNIERYFVNCTIGINYGRDNPDYTYFYSEMESGIQTVVLFSGAGVGLAIASNDGGTYRVMPKGSLFTGCINFLRTDVIIRNKRRVYDLGGSVVIPFVN